VVFAPDNGSVTTIRTESGELEVVSLGKTARTHVN
jgi:hypothetical protein